MGLVDSVYLTLVHYSGGALACSTSGVVNCDLVTRSSYGYVPSTEVPVALVGLSWFFVVVLVGVGLVVRPAWLSWPSVFALWGLLLAWSVVGIVPVLYLVWAELVPLHHLCEYCTVAHVMVLAILLVALSRTLSIAAERAGEIKGAEP